MEPQADKINPETELSSETVELFKMYTNEGIDFATWKDLSNFHDALFNRIAKELVDNDMVSRISDYADRLYITRFSYLNKMK